MPGRELAMAWTLRAMVLEDSTVSSPSYRSDSKLMQPDAT